MFHPRSTCFKALTMTAITGAMIGTMVPVCRANAQQSVPPSAAGAPPASAGTADTATQTPPAPGAPAAKSDAPAATPGKGKGKKAAYDGPNTLVVLPATPMLDEEGRQRLDLDGNPMFNPAVKQQRDKHGHPLFDEKGKPVMQTATDLGYDDNGKKIRAKKEQPPKMTPVSISRGTFTIDGVIGKAALNYDIPDLKYIYLYVPGIGIAVVSNAPFVGATEEKEAFHGESLTVTVENHTLEIASDKPLLGKGKKPASGYVLLDREFTLPSKYPVVGYGAMLKAPYAWPGSKVNPSLAASVPPVPANLQPVLLQAPCPAGQMRKPGPVPLPGEKAVEQPCVPIVVQGQTSGGAVKPSAPATPKASPSSSGAGTSIPPHRN